MEIKLLSQQEADDLMKTLRAQCLSNFRKAFHSERDKPRDMIWALPKEERLYYQVESYLFGVNPKPAFSIGISSFARILDATPEKSCAECLKKLICDKLVPMCKDQQKNLIKVALTEDGKRIFRALQAILPGVVIEPGQGYNRGRIELNI
jgi:hypothetical protein